MKINPSEAAYRMHTARGIQSAMMPASRPYLDVGMLRWDSDTKPAQHDHLI